MSRRCFRLTRAELARTPWAAGVVTTGGEAPGPREKRPSSFADARPVCRVRGCFAYVAAIGADRCAKHSAP